MGDAPAGRPAADRILDTSGLVCPLPIIRTAEAIGEVAVGQVLQVISTDFGILEDMPAWCTSMRHAFLGIDRLSGPDGSTIYQAFVRRMS